MPLLSTIPFALSTGGGKPHMINGLAQVKMGML